MLILTPEWCTLCEVAELQNGDRVPGRPKFDAGFRTVALPSVLVAVVREHLPEIPPSDPEGSRYPRCRPTRGRLRHSQKRGSGLHPPPADRMGRSVWDAFGLHGAA